METFKKKYFLGLTDLFVLPKVKIIQLNNFERSRGKNSADLNKTR